MNKPKQTATPPAPAAGQLEEPEPTATDIATLAYEIWEREGRPEGRDLDHWLMARDQLLRQRTAPSGPATPPTST